MRSKQLEILRLDRNPGMKAAVSTCIYNLAFSPKIRHIDLAGLGSADANVAEALYKLVKISGAIETLNLSRTGVQAHLAQEFYVALGENKTLKYLNLDSDKAISQSAALQWAGRAVAMNAYRNGALEALSLAGWFANHQRFAAFY